MNLTNEPMTAEQTAWWRERKRQQAASRKPANPRAATPAHGPALRSIWLMSTDHLVRLVASGRVRREDALVLGKWLSDVPDWSFYRFCPSLEASPEMAFCSNRGYGGPGGRWVDKTILREYSEFVRLYLDGKRAEIARFIELLQVGRVLRHPGHPNPNSESWQAASEVVILAAIFRAHNWFLPVLWQVLVDAYLPAKRWPEQGSGVEGLLPAGIKREPVSMFKDTPLPKLSPDDLIAPENCAAQRRRSEARSRDTTASDARRAAIGGLVRIMEERK